jgi:DNA-binding FadR family transcriptional regulator
MVASQILTRPGRGAGHDEIAAVLGSEVLSGSRPPGSRMPSVEELYGRFGASRVLMREVTKTLVAKGLVSAKTRVGTLVLPPEHWNWFDPDVLAWRVRLGLDPQFVKHLTQMRRAVEPAAAALAAEQRTDEHLAEMRKSVTGMTRAGSDRHAFVQADLDFHIAVAAASGNPLFRTLAAVIETALGAYFTLSTPIGAADIKTIVRRHARVADAIEARDPKAAASAMTKVVDEGFERASQRRS